MGFCFGKVVEYSSLNGERVPQFYTKKPFRCVSCGSFYDSFKGKPYTIAINMSSGIKWEQDWLEKYNE